MIEIILPEPDEKTDRLILHVNCQRAWFEYVAIFCATAFNVDNKYYFEKVIGVHHD
jgi:hypothetical protein